MLTSAQVPPSTQVPDIGSLTEGLPPWAKLVFVGCLAVVALAVAVPKVLPLFRSDDKPAAAQAEQPLVPASAAIATAADASNELIGKIVGRLEDRLDDANREINRLRDAYERQLEAMRKELDNEQKIGFELRSQLAEVTRQLEAARGEAVRLRWEIEAIRRGGPARW